jgi:son of sevenless
MKKDKVRRSPHVLLMIERFNYVSGWIATMVCQQENVKKRSKFIHRFIEVADRLRAMNNLNGVMEIVSGLNRGPVFRLKQAWDDVPSSARKTFEELRALTDRQKNYASTNPSASLSSLRFFANAHHFFFFVFRYA